MIRLEFSGVGIEIWEDGFRAHQRRYISKLQKLGESSYKAISSIKSKLGFTTLTRPDVSCTVELIAQVTEEMLEKSKKKRMKIVNNTIKKLKSLYDSTLEFPKLDQRSLQLRVYSDPSYINNEEKSSQIGYIIFLLDK